MNQAVRQSDMLRKAYDSILDRLLDTCLESYGSRLVSLVVFGSVGRRAMRSDSDVDLLIIARNLPKGRIPRIREFDAIEHQLKDHLAHLSRSENVNAYLSPILKTPDEVSLGSPLFLDMIDDARVLYDKGNFFQKQMARLRSRLKHLGARRIWVDDQWYWDLKPDYQIGEVFEI